MSTLARSICRFVPVRSSGGRENRDLRVSSRGCSRWFRSDYWGRRSSTEEVLDPAGRSVPVRGQGAFAGVGPGGSARRRSRRRADGPHRAPVQGAGHAPGAGCLPVGRGSLVRDRAEVLPGRPQPAAGGPGVFAMSTGPSWLTTSSSRRPIPDRRASRGFAIPIGRGRRGSSTGRWTARKASRSPCRTAT